jgi:hypothetical protein
VTRVEGALFVVLGLLSFAALTAGRPARLLTLVAWTLLVTPVATLEFSARTAVPAFGFLAAAAAAASQRVSAGYRLPTTGRKSGRAAPAGTALP